MGRSRGAEVREIERQHRQAPPLCERHQRGVGESEPEVRESRVDLGGPAQQARCQECDRVLTGRQPADEAARRVCADP